MKNYISLLKDKLIRGYAIIDEWLDFRDASDGQAEEELKMIVELILSDIERRLSYAGRNEERENIIQTCPRLHGCCSPAIDPGRETMVRAWLRQQLEECLFIADLSETDPTAIEIVSFIVEEIFDKTLVQKEYQIDARSTFSEQL